MHCSVTGARNLPGGHSGDPDTPQGERCSDRSWTGGLRRIHTRGGVFRLHPPAELRSHDNLMIASGIAIGLSLMVVIDRWLENHGMGEKKGRRRKRRTMGAIMDRESRTKKATVISIGMVNEVDKRYL